MSIILIKLKDKAYKISYQDISLKHVQNALELWGEYSMIIPRSGTIQSDRLDRSVEIGSGVRQGGERIGRQRDGEGWVR